MPPSRCAAQTVTAVPCSTSRRAPITPPAAQPREPRPGIDLRALVPAEERKAFDMRRYVQGLVDEDALYDALPLRRCTMKITARTRAPACALAEIGRCCAPCTGNVDPDVRLFDFAGRSIAGVGALVSACYLVATFANIPGRFDFVPESWRLRAPRRPSAYRCCSPRPLRRRWRT